MLLHLAGVNKLTFFSLSECEYFFSVYKMCKAQRPSQQQFKKLSKSLKVCAHCAIIFLFYFSIFFLLFFSCEFANGGVSTIQVNAIKSTSISCCCGTFLSWATFSWAEFVTYSLDCNKNKVCNYRGTILLRFWMTMRKNILAHGEFENEATANCISCSLALSRDRPTKKASFATGSLAR